MNLPFFSGLERTTARIRDDINALSGDNQGKITHVHGHIPNRRVFPKPRRSK
jgi:hypothetical protein